MSCFNIHFPYEPTLIIPGGGGGSGEANTASNVGGEVEVFKNKLGVDLQFRSLEAGDGITLTQNTNTVLIESTGSGKGWDAEEVKTSDQGITYTGGTNSDWVDVIDLDMALETDTLYDFEFHVLAETDNVGGYSDTYTAINVDFTGTYNTATWNQIDKDGTGNFHNFDDTALTGKGINAGENQEELTIIRGRIKTTSAGTLKLQTQYLDNVAGAGFTIADDSSIKVRKVNTFTNFQPSVGEANTGVNLGGGSGLYASKSGVALQFKSLKAGTNITLNETATEIEIVASGGGGGLTYWTESEYTYSGQTGTKWTPDTANTNQDIVLQPKGEGGLLSAQPDGTATGGNNRGRNAIDLQIIRYSAGQVASGQDSAILSGRANTSTSNDSLVVGGAFNSATTSFAVIVGGVFGTVSGSAQHSIIGAGGDNTITSPKSGILAGEDNTCGASHSFIGGGADNGTFGAYSGVLSGRGVIAYSYGEQVAGLYNTAYTANSTSAWNSSDKVFVVGNGQSDVARSNAFVVYKSGAVEINEAYTLPTADGTAGQVLQTDGSGNVSWATVGGGGGSTTLSNVGVGTTLVNALAGSNYPIKSIAGGGDTAVSTDGSTVTITTNTKTLTNVGGGNELVKTLTGDNYPIRTIIAGSGITVTENTNDITIESTVSAKTLSNVGTGTNLVNTLVGNDYPIKSIAGGGDTAVSTDGSTVTITTNNNTISNVGAGAEIGKAISSGNYPLRSIVGGTGITVTQGTDTITIDADNAGLTHWTESAFTFGGANGSKFTPIGVGNQDVVIQPKGTGAILGQQPDGTTGGGNVRGDYAVDLQMDRSNATQVASGDYSTVTGYKNTASGQSSVAMGEDNTSSGNWATSFGQDNVTSGLNSSSLGNSNNVSGDSSAGIGYGHTVSGDWSVGIGNGHTVSGDESFASGYQNISSGRASGTIGNSLFSRSRGEISVGMFNTDYTPNSVLSWHVDDRAFTVGIGENVSSRKNGLVLYKDGSLEINEEYTLPNADGNDGDVLVTDGAGTASFGVGNNIVLIEEQTVTGSATSGVDFSSLDLSDYYKIEVISEYIKGTHTDDTTVFMRINDEAGADYEVVADGGLSASGTGSGNNQASVGKAFQTAIDAESTHFLFSIINPGSTDRRKKWSSEYTYDIGSLNKGITRGRFEDSLAKVDREAAVTKISFFASTGNLDVGTTFKLIGYRHQS